MTLQSLLVSRLAKVVERRQEVVPSRHQPAPSDQVKWSRMITSIQSYRPENTKTWGNCGSNTFHQVQLRDLTWSISRMNLIRSYKKGRRERPVSAQSEKNYTHSRSMKLSDRLPLTVLREVSYLLELGTKSRWPSRPTRHYTKVQ